MRIAILAWESLHSIAVGGLAAHTTELAAALAARGHQVHVFTRRMLGQLAHDCIDDVHYHRCFYIPQGDFVDDVNSMCRAFVDRVFEVEDFVGRFDVVHAHDWLGANAMIWIKQGRGHKTVLTIHSTEYGRCGNAFVNGRSVRVREQEKAGTYWADKVIAVSQATKNEIMWMYAVPDSKVQVIGNGVDWRRFDIQTDPGKIKAQYGIAPLDPIVFFCGRLVWQKGPDILVEAIPAVLRLCSNAKFVFAGDGDMRGGLQARAQNLGIAPAVRFLGYKNGDELVRLFKSSDTVCVPSRNEPFGIVVLEGWAAVKPVVVTENGGPNEYVRHETNGLKIYPRPDSVSWGINRVFSNFDWARQLGSNGRQLLEQQFSWDKVVEKTLGVYREVAPEAWPQPAQLSSELYAGHPAALGQRRNRAGVKLEAKVLIPASAKDDRTCAALEVLNETLAGRRCALEQKERYLKIRGDWEEVTIALSEFHKNITRVGKRTEWSAGFCRDS